MVDRVKPLKMETSIDGTEEDVGYTELDPTEDYVAAKGLAFENSNTKTIDTDAAGDIQFKDTTNPTGRTLKSITDEIASKETTTQLNARDTLNRNRENHTGAQTISTVVNLQAALDAKYNASNPAGYETPTQLTARDTANRERANHTGTQISTTISDFSSAANALITALKGAVSGLAPLGTDQLIPSIYLPSYVDDILEYANFTALPVTGESGKIYVTLAASNGYPANMQYRWSGTAYQPVVSSPGTTDNVVEGVSNLYFTVARVLSTALAGLTSSNAVILASDTVLSAFGKAQGQISAVISNLAANYETITQLNTRSTNDKARANHTGTQLANTISDFSSAVLAVILSGLSVATGTAVLSTDTVLVAIGKLQAQASANATAIGLRALSATTISAGTGLSGGGDLTANRTISMPNVGTAGSSGAADKYNVITTDAQGRVVNIVPTLISIISSQISNFTESVLGTALTGLSTATSTVVTATDSIFSAIGKLQAQISNIVANANNLAISRVTAQASFATASTSYVVITGFTLTPTVAGTYAIEYGLNLTASMNNAVIKSQLFRNNVAVVDSEAAMTGRSGTNDIINWGSYLQFNGTTDNVELRVNISLGVLTVNNRRLRMIRVGP